MLHYFIIIITLFLLIKIYFKLASKYNIIDRPNHRSAHTEITLRGGGIIFWFSSIIYFLLHFQDNYFFFIGITIVSFVSFWDDIQNLPNKIRITAHFVAISLIFLKLELFEIYSWWIIIACYILVIGIINAYNFMDGINGITGLYTIVVLSSIFYVNQYIIKITEINQSKSYRKVG